MTRRRVSCLTGLREVVSAGTGRQIPDTPDTNKTEVTGLIMNCGKCSLQLGDILE
jgi:hypothetical protein